MKSSYLSKYTIVQTFKSNDFQKIYIGTDNKDNQAVVINTISTKSDSSAWDLIEQNYKNILNQILHFERTENQIVFVTKVEEGLSLDTYLNNFSPSFTERTNLIHQYLNGIKRYDILPNNIKSVLSNESQIIINGNKLFFDELIIFNENSLAKDTFSSVRNNIISVLRKLTSLGSGSINYEELQLYASVMRFLDKVQKNDKPYHTINDIFNDLENINIHSLSTINHQESILNTNKNHVFNIAISTAVIVAVAVALSRKLIL